MEKKKGGSGPQKLSEIGQEICVEKKKKGAGLKQAGEDMGWAGETEEWNGGGAEHREYRGAARRGGGVRRRWKNSHKKTNAGEFPRTPRVLRKVNKAVGGSKKGRRLPARKIPGGRRGKKGKKFPKHLGD